MAEGLIASSKLIGIARDGSEREFTVGVGIPAQRPTGEWACPTLTQDFEEPRPVYGEDSLQAICLGLGFIRARLEHLLERGGRLLLAESREEIPLAQLDVLFGKAV
jgi:hypothetical protein